MSSSSSTSPEQPEAPGADAAAPAVNPAATASGGRGGGKKKEPPTPSVPYRALFRYASPLDLWLNALAIVAAAINGFIFPGFALLFGRLLAAFNDPTAFSTSVINEYALWFLIIALGAGVMAFLDTTIPMWTSERQIRRVREEYVRALLRQEIGYYDLNKAGEMAARMTEDSITMMDGMGTKLSMSVRFTVTFLGGLGVGFASSWQLTLVMMASLPIIVAIMGFLSATIRGAQGAINSAYSKAGDAATETFSSIRTVQAYGGEAHEVRRYDSHLAVAEKSGSTKGIMLGVAVGAIFGTMFLFYGIASLVAGVLIVNGRNANSACYNPTTPGCFSGSNVVQTLMAVLVGSFSLGQVGPNFSAFAAAQTAAHRLFSVIDRVPPVDVASPAGARPPPSALRGSVEFRNVSFSYPSRPDEPVLRDFSLTVPGGSTVALVGESGCGKSTLLQLLQRYYEPSSGAILVDGLDVREWNLAHLRDRIGVVSQEPTLFAVSVAENIGYGKPAALGPASAEEVEAAARAANAHEFIARLPEGYASLVGTSTASTTLSGGQRQRVCIARAILRAPALLLLDEATSALDTNSERLVQAALDALVDGERDAATGARARTSIIVAHRLSTITHADCIVVLARGAIVEQGSHEQLMARQEGAYRRLRAMQDVSAGGSGGSGGDGAAGAAAAAAHEAALASKAAAEAEAVTGAIAAAAAAAAAAAPPGVDAAVAVAVDEDAAAAATAPKTRSRRGGGDDEAAAAPLKGAAAGGTATEKSAKRKEEEEWAAAAAALPKVPWGRVWALQKPEAVWLAVGLVGSAISGVTQPIFAILWSNMIAFLFSPDNNVVLDNTRIYVLWFALLGLMQLLSTVMRIGSFVYAGEKLTRRLRTLAYAAVLRQEVGFFEERGNSVGRLATRLAADAAEVKGGTGEGLSLVFQSLASVIAGVVIAFTANWQLALVVVSIMPLLIGSFLVQSSAFKGYTIGAAKALEESGHIAVESTAAIKTVTAFNLQPSMHAAFARSLDAPQRAGRGQALSAGVGQAFNSVIMFGAYSLAFYAGGQFIALGWCDFAALMRVYLAVTLSAQAAGNAISWGPDSAKADRGTRSVFALLDRRSSADALAEDGEPLSAADAAAAVLELREVHFAYPSRPRDPVLHGVSLAVRPGQKVALVGPSGSGKSTVIQLLLRFYEPASGQLLLAGLPLPRYSLAALRAQFGLIQQEPALFADSIAYNIEYGRAQGKPQWDGGAPLDPPEGYELPAGAGEAPPDVAAAAAAANAAGFIAGFKHGYATNCGSRGNAQLSGGQRQRLCIARAILRAPAVTLCDEATSALDSASERVVQQALDRILQGGGGGGGGGKEAATGKTSIVIAHRLATIKDADVIYVMDRGRVVEVGTHDTLFAKRGLYHSLATAQGAGSDGAAAAAAEAAAGEGQPLLSSA